MLLLLTLGITCMLRDRFALTIMKGRVLCFHIQGDKLGQQHIQTIPIATCKRCFH